MSDKHKKTSKFLSLVLRHEPQLVGITLDEAGWVDVDVLLEGCRRKGQAVTRAELEEVVRTSDKQRFALSEDGKRIRANQGHSVPVELGYESAEPPEVLLHGTAEKAIDGIRREGIHKGQRHHVHLSEREDTAGAVGRRHGKLVVFEVAAGRMRRDGFAFFRTPNGVWLVDHVPPEYLKEMQNDECRMKCPKR
jgi:putative RNA 2'-phosphotransferase